MCVCFHRKSPASVSKGHKSVGGFGCMDVRRTFVSSSASASPQSEALPETVRAEQILGRCRDERAYGHTTTAMHDDEYTPPSRFLLVSLLCGPRLHRRVGRDKYAFRRVSIGASCRRTVVNCLVRTTSHGGTVCSIQCVARAVFLYTSDAAPPW